MSRGLYSVAEVARYFGKRRHAVAAMIERDALPCVQLPGDVRMVRKFTLHGLHGWLKARHTGTSFMSVDELAAEIAAANGVTALTGVTDEGATRLRAAVEMVFESIKREMERSRA